MTNVLKNGFKLNHHVLYVEFRLCLLRDYHTNTNLYFFFRHKKVSFKYRDGFWPYTVYISKS